MDGPTHYTEAESMYVKARMSAAAADGVSASLFIQAAQFHATMAVAAATAELAQAESSHTEQPIPSGWATAFSNNPQEAST